MGEQSDAPSEKDPQRVWRIGLQAVAVIALVVAFVDISDLSYFLVRKGMTQSQVRTLLGRPDFVDLVSDSIPPPDDGKYVERRFYSYYSSGLIHGKSLTVEWDSEQRVRQVRFFP